MFQLGVLHCNPSWSQQKSCQGHLPTLKVVLLDPNVALLAKQNMVGLFGGTKYVVSGLEQHEVTINFVLGECYTTRSYEAICRH